MMIVLIFWFGWLLFWACLSLTLIRLTCFGNLCWSSFHRLRRYLRVRVLSVFGMFIANAIGFDLPLTIWIFFGVCVCGCIHNTTLPSPAAAVQSCCKVHAAVGSCAQTRVHVESLEAVSLFSSLEDRLRHTDTLSQRSCARCHRFRC